MVKELQGQHAILRDCIEHLGAMETSRTSLVSHLREALQEQVYIYTTSYKKTSLVAPARNLTLLLFLSRNSSWSKSATTFRYELLPKNVISVVTHTFYTFRFTQYITTLSVILSETCGSSFRACLVSLFKEDRPKSN